MVFFAYQGRYGGNADENVDAIYKAVNQLNQYQKTYIAKKWEDFRKTAAINVDVLRAIDNAEVFVCDLTYFNHNVLFELGYAVAKNKSILILLNENIRTSFGMSKDIYRDSFLKVIRYVSLSNANDIVSALENKNYKEKIIKDFLNLNNATRDSNDLFYIQSKIKTQPSLDLTEAIDLVKQEKKFTLISDDSYEVEYRSINWYLQNIYKSRCIVIHLLGENVKDAYHENARNSFFGGLSCGLGQKVLFVAPAKYKAPLDYHDILFSYQDSNALIDFIIPWLTDVFVVPRVLSDQEKIEEEHELNLIKLGIGSDVAEREREELLNYFIETASYNFALRENQSLLVGTKGSGKSAIYVKMLDDLSRDNRNYILNLNPESHELLEDVEMSELFNSPASKKSFFVSIWKLVIFSKLLELIVKNVGKKVCSDVEQAIINFFNNNKEFIKKNFFGVVREISIRLNKSSHVSSPDIMQSLYKEYLIPLIKVLKDYFQAINAKYIRIVILADGLDKTWDAEHNLDIQAELIITLLDINNIIQNELVDKKQRKVDLKQIIFLRKDIFDYLLKVISEPDKLITMSHEIDWANYPNLLKQVVENRFKYILNLKSGDEIGKVWNDFFEVSGKKHPFDRIKEIIVIRPRDVIYFVSQLFESAVDKGHRKVNDDDFQYAIENYTKFLNQNLIAEVKAEYPEIDEILTCLQEYHGEVMDYNIFLKILGSFKYNSDRKDALTSLLFKRGYMIGFDKNFNKPFSEIEILKAKVKNPPAKQVALG